MLYKCRRPHWAPILLARTELCDYIRHRSTQTRQLKIDKKVFTVFNCSDLVSLCLGCDCDNCLGNAYKCALKIHCSYQLYKTSYCIFSFTFRQKNILQTFIKTLFHRRDVHMQLIGNTFYRLNINPLKACLSLCSFKRLERLVSISWKKYRS